MALFNPLNWERHDPVILDVPQGESLEGSACQTHQWENVVQSPPAVRGHWVSESAAKNPEPPKRSDPSAPIETRYYAARIDPNTGALVSLRVKPSGREILGGPANMLVAEKPKSQDGDPGDMMLPRPERIRLSHQVISSPPSPSRADRCYGCGNREQVFRRWSSRRIICFYTITLASILKRN